MPIVPMRDILKDAREKEYAVGSYNAYNLTLVRGILQAAEEEKSPVILAHAPVHFKYTSLESVANIIIHEAKKSKVPVSLLLDHGYDIDTCKNAMNLGFNAVMMDASRHPLDENIEMVSHVVNIAHKKGYDVEGEIGYVTRPISGKDEGEDDDSIIDDKSLYTDPDDAEQFILRTKVDALAVAFGTAHGIYIRKPVLDIKRLAKIRSLAHGVPLVMHGGSGLSEKDIIDSIGNGICKINYYTGMAINTAEEVKSYLNDEDQVFYHNLMMKAIDAVSKDVAKSIRLFGSSGRA
ncbi:MAG: class II fructose-bisphosphate aldolase [Clostridia bacterium]|nr:class II fructose-bisphosphate aldolase [Clostridia bacterium]